MTGLAHPRLSRTLAELAGTQEHRARCSEPPPPLLVRGIHEFNHREFFECHETLEVLWRLEPHPVRYLYQGILHVAVGYYHQRRGNHRGALAKLSSGCALLDFFEPRCQGVEVTPLVATARRCQARLLELGPRRIAELDDALIVRVELVGPQPDAHSGPLPELPLSKAAAERRAAAESAP